MRQVFSGLAGAVAIIGFSAATQPNADEVQNIRLIHAGTLLAVPGERPLGNSTIVISSNRILRVEEGFTDPSEIEGDPEVIDLREAYVMPGVIDMHVHVTIPEPDPERPTKFLVEVATQNKFDRAYASIGYVKTLLMQGVTTARDVGAFGDGAAFALRDAIASGQVIGPRLYAAGPLIGPTGGGIDLWVWNEEFQKAYDDNKFGSCDGEDQCRQVVRENVMRGADVIKLKNGGGCQPSVPRFTMAELRTIVETAHKLGRKVTIHGECPGIISDALNAGVDAVEHGVNMNDTNIRLFKETDAFLVPTLLPSWANLDRRLGMANTEEEVAVARAIFEERLEPIRKAYRAGVKIAYGSDTGAVTPHDQANREFELMAEVGMSNEAILAAATVVAADLLGVASDVGTLEEGKFADIIATAGNPIDDITEMRRVKFVMKAGTIYKNEF